MTIAGEAGGKLTVTDHHGRQVWAVIPARSGSKGLQDKNVRPLAGIPLIGHSINFAHKSGLFEKVLLSTDSPEYATIGEKLGAWVPFLRAEKTAADASMEEDLLADLDHQLAEKGLTPPDILVWLRPTFPFRAIDDLKAGLALLDQKTDSVRLVTEGEPRLYSVRNGFLVPEFDDQGRSMIQRQEFPDTFRVFHTDIFWYANITWGARFLGERVKALAIHKICQTDIDTLEDLEIAEALFKASPNVLGNYTHVHT